MNFNFWYGVVVDTNNATKLPLYRVRIYGQHPQNQLLVPDDALPWATASHSTNGGLTFFSPITEGTYVHGFYEDGLSKQRPVITGVAPGIASVPLHVANTASNYIQTDKPNGLGGAGVGQNQPNTGNASRGDVANTNVQITNNMLSHSCDFRLFINLGLLGGLQNPVTAILNAIKAGKNRAAQAIRLMLSQINQYLRDIVNAIVAALGLDPTGKLSSTFSEAKAIIRKINYYTKKVAMIAEMASFYVNLVNDIGQIVAYIKSLPAKFLAMLQNCLTQFLNSITNFASMLSQIPGMASGSVNDMLAQLGVASQTASDSANAASAQVTANTANSSVTDMVTATINASDSSHANILLSYITTNYPNANVVFASSSANTFSTSNMQTP